MDLREDITASDIGNGINKKWMILPRKRKPTESSNDEKPFKLAKRVKGSSVSTSTTIAFCATCQRVSCRDLCRSKVSVKKSIQDKHSKVHLCICGLRGDWYNCMLECRHCKRWFHETCVGCLRYKLICGDTFYLYVCEFCNKGKEFLHRLHIDWENIVHLALWNLSYIKTLPNIKGKYFDYMEEITPWINNHWELLQCPPEYKSIPKQKRIQFILTALQLNVNKFKCGSEIRKKRSIWGLRRKNGHFEFEPPNVQDIILPPERPFSEASIPLITHCKRTIALPRPIVQSYFRKKIAEPVKSMKTKLQIEPLSVKYQYNRVNKKAVVETNNQKSLIITCITEPEVTISNPSVASTCPPLVGQENQNQTLQIAGSNNSGIQITQQKILLKVDTQSRSSNKISLIKPAVKFQCICGLSGDWYDCMLECRRCKQWFHEKCVGCLPHKLIYGDMFYLYVCKLCNNGKEFIQRLHIDWENIVHLALWNLSQTKKGKYFDYEKEITPWIDFHWELLVKYEDTFMKYRTQRILSVLKKKSHKFKCGKEIDKKPSIWALRNPDPPGNYDIILPPETPFTEELIPLMRFCKRTTQLPAVSKNIKIIANMVDMKTIVEKNNKLKFPCVSTKTKSTDTISNSFITSTLSTSSTQPVKEHHLSIKDEHIDIVNEELDIPHSINQYPKDLNSGILLCETASEDSNCFISSITSSSSTLVEKKFNLNWKEEPIDLEKREIEDPFRATQYPKKLISSQFSITFFNHLKEEAIDIKEEIKDPLEVTQYHENLNKVILTCQENSNIKEEPMDFFEGEIDDPLRVTQYHTELNSNILPEEHGRLKEEPIEIANVEREDPLGITQFPYEMNSDIPHCAKPLRIKVKNYSASAISQSSSDLLLKQEKSAFTPSNSSILQEMQEEKYKKSNKKKQTFTSTNSRILQKMQMEKYKKSIERKQTFTSTNCTIPQEMQEEKHKSFNKRKQTFTSTDCSIPQKMQEEKYKKLNKRKQNLIKQEKSAFTSTNCSIPQEKQEEKYKLNKRKQNLIKQEKSAFTSTNSSILQEMPEGKYKKSNKRKHNEYSQEQMEKALEALKTNSFRKVSQELGIPTSTLKRWKTNPNMVLGTGSSAQWGFPMGQ